MLPKEIKAKRTKSQEQALTALQRLCARAEKCEGDARRLMRGWGVAPEDAERVLQRLVADRFIDDSRYAAAFVREKTNLSGWGEYKIRAALGRKEVARSVIDEALRQADRTHMGERLVAAMERKARTARAATPYELKTKLIRYGLSLGYEYEAVMNAATTITKIQCEEF